MNDFDMNWLQSPSIDPKAFYNSPVYGYQGSKTPSLGTPKGTDWLGSMGEYLKFAKPLADIYSLYQLFSGNSPQQKYMKLAEQDSAKKWQAFREQMDETKKLNSLQAQGMMASKNSFSPGSGDYLRSYT